MLRTRLRRIAERACPISTSRPSGTPGEPCATPSMAVVPSGTTPPSGGSFAITFQVALLLVRPSMSQSRCRVPRIAAPAGSVCPTPLLFL
ncbi:hypothetical protein BBK14_13865 [Parafrankia soli]|uniref:Uncharacterized protein n=1 Tax=Parafrankia soli TaxID=2599596 RepID=A0A1S1QZP2_9ACTN|nr:hypothetical protein BBK14_13865 [Parafrankia soli]